MSRHYRFVANPPRGPLGWWMLLPLAAVSLACLAWTVIGTDANPRALVEGFPWIADFIGRMLPPNLGYIRENLIGPALQTIQIALLGTLLSIVLAVPVSFIAARNLSPSPWLYHASRQVLNLLRGINEIILALIPARGRLGHGR